MIDENKIKESFTKIKEDILYLNQELLILKQELKEIKKILHINIPAIKLQHSTHTSTHNLKNYALKSPYFNSSIGNDGVPTDRQQTDNRQKNILKRTFKGYPKKEETNQDSLFLPLSNLSHLSNILDNIKNDLGEKFKKLTKQEFLIFSLLYTLEEELDYVTYNDLAKRTGLTGSSIRDYIARLIKKGIPITKEKQNNKIVLLKIPRELKDIATLDKLTKLKNLEI